MKLNKFLWSFAAIAALGLASCSTNDTPSDPNEGDNTDPDARYLAVNINTSGVGSRDDSDYEAGTDAENAVTSSRFYFFNDGGAAVNVSISGNQATGTSTESGAVNWINGGTLTPVSTNMSNVEEKLKAVLVIKANKDVDISSIKYMVACLNLPSGFDGGSLSLSALEAKIADYSAHTNGAFILTSSVYLGGTTPSKQITASITSDNLKKTEAEAILNPVQIYVERVVSKVRLSTNITAIGEAITSGTGDATITYCKTEQTIKIGSDEKNIYAKLEPWYITTESNVSYLFKSINNTWNAMTLWSGWNDATNYRSYWALNPPTTGTPAWGVVYHKYAAPETGNTDNGKVATATYTTGNNYLYTQENANYVNASSATDPALNTKVLVKATLGYFTDEADASSFKPITIGTFGFTKYIITKDPSGDITEDKLAEAILEYLQKQGNLPYYYYDDAASKYKQITAADLTYVTTSSLVPGYNGAAEDKTGLASELHLAHSKRYEVKVQLSTTGAAKHWYKAIVDENTPGDEYSKDEAEYATMTDVEKATKDAELVNAKLLNDIVPVKVWNDGATYYHFTIKHLNTPVSVEKGKEPEGYFGVVRNHIYDCKITGVTGLGTPVYNPDEYIIPEDVDDEELSAVAAQINILSWRIVSQDVILGQ